MGTTELVVFYVSFSIFIVWLIFSVVYYFKYIIKKVRQKRTVKKICSKSIENSCATTEKVEPLVELEDAPSKELTNEEFNKLSDVEKCLYLIARMSPSEILIMLNKNSSNGEFKNNKDNL